MATLSNIITPSNVLTASNTATLTNKTINAANNTVTNVSLSTGVTGTLPAANGGTGLASPGANGNVLTSNGSAWTSSAPPAASALVFINSVTATAGASTLDLTSGLTSTYGVYMLVGSGLRCSANQGAVNITVYIGGSWISTGYDYFSYTGASSAGTINNIFATNNTEFIFANDFGGGVSEGTLNFVLYIYNPSSTALWKSFSWAGATVAYTASNNTQMVFNGGGAVKNTGALTGIRLTPGSRVMQGGVFRLYGISNS